MSVLPTDVAVYGSYYDPAYDGAATLNGAIASTTATSVPINLPSVVFPSTGEFAIQVDSEIMWVTQGAPGGAAGTLTVIRGFGGTTAATHLTAAAVTMPIGGPINPLSKLSFTDVTSGDTLDYVSSSASDTKVQIQAIVRDTTGVLQTETKTLNGTTVVNGAQVCDRIERVALAAATTMTTAGITNAATTIGVTTAGNLPASGNYFIQMGLEVMQVTAGQGTSSLTVTRGQAGTTATAHNQTDNIYLLPLGDVAVVDHTKVINGHTAQTGSANPTGTTPALFKLQAADGASIALGQVILITSGTGSGQIRTIAATSGYGTDIVAVSRSWGVVPDNTSVYSVYNGAQLDLAPNPVTEARRFLYNAAADVAGGSSRTFYQKGFVMNNNTTLAGLAAQYELASNSPSLPGSAALDLALGTGLNDVVTSVNRQTNLGSGYGSFVVQPAFINQTANSGNLGGGAAPNLSNSLGLLLRYTLPAGTAPYKGATLFQSNVNTV